MSAIQIRGLHKSFGRTAVLDGLELDVEQGEVFALLGPNGAGKSTTIGVLTTLVKPEAGEARVAGFDVVQHPEEVKRRITLTGQSAAVDGVLTGTENLAMMARLCGLSPRAARARAAELLERFDLTDAGGRRADAYSGGMRRRLDLALSLVVTPKVLFLDEPTTGLDTRSRRELWNAIRHLAHAGTTVFLTTQYLEEADELADRVAVLDGGRISAEGTPAQLKSRVGGTVVQLHDAHGALLRELPTDGSVADLRRVLSETDDGSVTVSLRRPSLDDVFLALTSTAARRGAEEAAPQKESA